MSRLRKRPSDNSANTSRSRKMNDSVGYQPKPLADQLFDSWNEKAERERLMWSSKPRLDTAIFEDAWRDEELKKILAANNAVVQNIEKFARQNEKRREDIDRMTATLGWSSERLKEFIERVVAYRKTPSIENYLHIRRNFPEVEIQVGLFGGIEALFKLEQHFKKQGIDPALVAGALDANEPSIDALCLRLLELLSARDRLPKNGPGRIEKRRNSVNDATVNYLIATMLEAYDWNEDIYRVPASLVVLIRHQISGEMPDLEVEVRLRERQHHVAIGAARFLKPGEQLSINKLKQYAGISRTSAARWLADPYFQSCFESARRWVSEGLFEEIAAGVIN